MIETNAKYYNSVLSILNCVFVHVTETVRDWMVKKPLAESIYI